MLLLLLLDAVEGWQENKNLICISITLFFSGTFGIEKLILVIIGTCWFFHLSCFIWNSNKDRQ